MHGADLIWLFLGPALVAMVVMIICGGLAKTWLEQNAGYQPSRTAAFFLGPLLTSFGPVKMYAEIRARRSESTTLATVFWIATAFWGLGLAGFFVWLAVMMK